MTTFISSVTAGFANSSPYGAFSNGIAVIAMILLFTLLIEKVLIDAYHGKSTGNTTQAFAIVISPLLLVVVAFVFLRIAQVLHLL